jgi:hypothetical protein
MMTTVASLEHVPFGNEVRIPRWTFDDIRLGDDPSMALMLRLGKAKGGTQECSEVRMCRLGCVDEAPFGRVSGFAFVKDLVSIVPGQRLVLIESLENGHVVGWESSGGYTI